MLALLAASQSHNLSTDVVGIIIVTSAAAWIAGFITPGAPAGVGIREAILVLSLTQLFDASLAVIVTFMYRLITVVGDFTFLVSSRLLTLWRHA